MRKGKKSMFYVRSTEKVSVCEKSVHVGSILNLVLIWLQWIIRLLRVWYVFQIKTNCTVYANWQSCDQRLANEGFPFVLKYLAERLQDQHRLLTCDNMTAYWHNKNIDFCNSWKWIAAYLEGNHSSVTSEISRQQTVY